MYSRVLDRKACSASSSFNPYRSLLFSIFPSIELHPRCRVPLQYPVLWSWSRTEAPSSISLKQRGQMPPCFKSCSSLKGLTSLAFSLLLTSEPHHRRGPSAAWAGVDQPDDSHPGDGMLHPAWERYPSAQTPGR